MWAKPTAPPSWGNESASGRPKPCVRPIRKPQKTPERKWQTFAHRSRRTSSIPKSNEAKRLAREKRLDSVIDKARRSFPPWWLRLWRAWLRLPEKVSNSPKPSLTRRKYIPGSHWPFGIEKRRASDDDAHTPALRWLH